MPSERKKGIVLGIVLLFILLVAIAATSFMLISLSEIKMARRQNNSTKAFYVAEAGIQKYIYLLKTEENYRSNYPDLDEDLGGGGYLVDASYDEGDSTYTLISTGTFSSIKREIQVQVWNSWLNKIPAAVYSKGVEKIDFDKRDDAYIAGGVDGTDTDDIAGIYCTGEVKTKEGEGRITGDPAISENQDVPTALQDGIWDAFDINDLREKAIADGTYFQGDEYNKEGKKGKKGKKAKYTLPVVEGETEGIFFFDTKDGVVFDDDAINNKNEAKVELKGTAEQISGVIVVVGDLTIKDTNNYDFLFDGVILVLDDLKIDDKRHHRRFGGNDSDIFIKGAVLSDNIIDKGRKRKKKPAIDIKNATIEYDPEAIINIPSGWKIVPGSWQEI